MKKDKQKISIITSCFNERDNLPEFYDRIMNVLHRFDKYDYEFVVADNCSTDGSRDVLRALAKKDKGLLFNHKIHLADNTANCESCHNETAWTPATFDHLHPISQGLQ